jgi:hypothetical protein
MYRCPFCETGLCLGGGLVWRLSSVLVGRGSDGLAAYKYDTIRCLNRRDAIFLHLYTGAG